MSNIFGKNIKIEIYGESHGAGVGAVIDGLPAGIDIDTDYINAFMARRKSDGVLGTGRIEEDRMEILSGVYKNKTTGTPLTVLIRNKDKNSSNYTDEVIIPRPSHADFPAHIRYSGYADMRGGGHSSGRLTAPLVFAGAICMYILENMGITMASHLLSVGCAYDVPFDMVNVEKNALNNLRQMKIPVINNEVGESIIREIETARDAKDSIGGIIECAVLGIKAGYGSPFFYSVESAISSMLFSIPAVKGVEFGAGFSLARMKGSQANDCYRYDKSNVRTLTNNNGGILGGITNGMPIILRCAIKPTPSIFIKQQSVNLIKKKDTDLIIEGRHDPCIALRALPVIEAGVAIALLDIIKDVR